MVTVYVRKLKNEQRMKKDISFKIIIFHTALFLAVLQLNAQQWQSFNTYPYDLMQVNVAGIGQNYFSANLNYRAAMLGVKNGPRLYQADGALALGRQAVGAKIYQNSVGLSDYKVATGAYIYKLKIDEKKWLYMGLGVSFMQSTFNAQRAIVWDEDDVNLYGGDNAVRANNFDSEAGVVWYGEKLTAGLSVNHLYNTNMGNAIVPQKQQLNLHVSYNFKAGSDFTVTPMLMNRYTVSSAYTIPDLLLTTTYKNMLALGLGYRNKGTMLVNLAGLYKSLKVVYSFDYSFSQVSKRIGTSHQVMIGFQIKDKKTSSQ